MTNPSAVISPDARHRLDAFLAARGVTLDMLNEAADTAYGHPLLVVASGSILHGVGNRNSDIDLNVVVDQPVAKLPISSFAQGSLVDVMYFSRSEVEAWPGAIQNRSWPPVGLLPHREWHAHLQRLSQAMRFAYGCVLSAQDGWTEWPARFREPWLAAHVTRWWRTESARCRTAAGWLAAAKPLLAAQCALEAVLAAFESRAAAAGQPFYGPKWLTEKMRLLGDQDGYDTLRHLAKTPMTPADVPAYIARCEALLDERDVRPEPHFDAQLWLQAGVTTQVLDGRTVVSRWNMRAVALRGKVPIVSDSSQPLWQGPVDAPPPPHILPLFLEDLTWMSIVARQ